MKEAKRESTNEGLEKRLENLSNILEKQFSVEEMRKSHPVEPQEKENRTEGFQFIKMLYRTLLENDVNEKYVNQIMDEAEKVLHNGSSVDSILSNVYQKLILKFDQPQTIELTGKKPKVIFFIGPTGVGKTTTLAKIASRYKVDKEKKVAFLTADTYRIAATEQLRIYANILDAPMSIIYTPEEMNDAIARVSEYDLVFVDTAGFSHRNEAQCQDMKKLIDGLDEAYEKEVYLVLSATTKYKDLLEIARFKLWRAYSVNTSVSLVAGAWSASVSKIVSRSRMEIPSESRFCRTFWISPSPRSFGTSSSTRTGLLSLRLLTRFCTSCLVSSSAIWERITSVRCVAMIDGGSTTV